MTRKLTFSDKLAIPLEAVTQTFAILARKRVGKTYTASVIAEEMLEAGLPFVVLDPTGAWWGLRAKADGKGEGYPVIIIGGAHGDIPLEPTAGKVIAELVVDHPGHYIIDLSGTESDAEQDRFATDFATRLYRYKEQHRFPMHLFIDEADSFAPQRPFENQKRMLGAFEAIVRRGGIRGIGVTFITQRPAVLNKNVLTQTECLIVLQMSAPQDQDAIDDWIKRNGTPEQRETMMGSLASLKMGEAWVWSPSWLECFERVRVRARKTFNSSATPKAGEKAVMPQRLAPVDLDAIKAQVAATIEAAKANDPDELKREIADLKRQLKARPTQAEPVIQRVEVPVLGKADLQRISRKAEVLFHETSAICKKTEEILGSLNMRLSDVTNLLDDLKALEAKGTSGPISALAQHPYPPSIKTVISQAIATTDLPRGERAVLEALIQYPAGLRREQITVLTTYKRSSRDAYIQRLREKGCADTSGDRVTATPKGVATLPDARPLPTGQALQEFWFQRLPVGEKAILEVLIRDYPKSVDRNSLDEATNYKRSSRDAYLQRLGAKELVTYVGQGRVRASDTLMENQGS